MGSRTTTHPLKIAINRVKVIEAISDPDSWKGRKRDQVQEEGDTQNELEKFRSSGQDRDDVWTRQTFPPDNLTVEYLLVSSTMQVGKVDNDLPSPLQFLFGIHSWYPDANACTIDTV